MTLLHDGPDAEAREAWQRVPIVVRWILVSLIDGVEASSRWRSRDRATFDRDFLEVVLRGPEDADRTRLCAMVTISRADIESAADPDWLIIDRMRALVAENAPEWFLPFDADAHGIVSRRWREMQIAEAEAAARVRELDAAPAYAWLDDGRPQ